MGWTGAAYLGLGLAVCLAFIFASRKTRIIWWQALLVLAFPPAVLVFVFRKETWNRPVWILFVIGGLAAASGLDYHAYRISREQNRYSHLPPVIRKMIILNEQVKASTIAVYQASEKLSSLSLSQSRVADINTTLGVISRMQMLIRSNQADINALVDYIDQQGGGIQHAHLDWALSIAEFYRDPRVKAHAESREAYLTAFGQVLQYTHDHYDQIMEEKSPLHRANYNAYYLRYRGVAERHSAINRDRIEFQSQFVVQHPEVRPFLPGPHHREPFRFWDHLSF